MHSKPKHVKHSANPNPKPVRTLDAEELRQVTGGVIKGTTIPVLDGSSKDST